MKLQVVERVGEPGVANGWYVDQDDGIFDGPHSSREDAEHIREAMAFARAFASQSD
jgi:hypothetical protein